MKLQPELNLMFAKNGDHAAAAGSLVGEGDDHRLAQAVLMMGM